MIPDASRSAPGTIGPFSIVPVLNFKFNFFARSIFLQYLSFSTKIEQTFFLFHLFSLSS